MVSSSVDFKFVLNNWSWLDGVCIALYKCVQDGYQLFEKMFIDI